MAGACGASTRCPSIEFLCERQDIFGRCATTCTRSRQSGIGAWVRVITGWFREDHESGLSYLTEHRRYAFGVNGGYSGGGETW